MKIRVTLIIDTETGQTRTVSSVPVGGRPSGYVGGLTVPQVAYLEHFQKLWTGDDLLCTPEIDSHVLTDPRISKSENIESKKRAVSRAMLGLIEHGVIADNPRGGLMPGEHYDRIEQNGFMLVGDVEDEDEEEDLL